ncbi:MAG: deoxyribonuclease IV [Euryarchaeota archaeon]|nr:deoxyribonuclease IV [Euryarchaeota archaeon]
MLLGAHESISGGLHNALRSGKGDGCECVQLFTKNASQWKARPLAKEDAVLFAEARGETGIDVAAAHDSYLINLGAPDEASWNKSKEAFLEEMRRAEFVGLQFLIFHPGAHKGSGEREGIERIASAIAGFLGETKGDRLVLLLETTAGQGSYLGYRFEHLADVIGQAGGGGRLGVCYDTCHTFAAGYDIRTSEGWDDVLEDFDSIVGLERLRAFHLNDSKGALGSKLDRHEQIGKGAIGLEAFRCLVNNPAFKETPGFLETPPLPNGEDSFKKNLKLLKSLREKR